MNERPATQSQLEHARKLGIEIPQNPTFNQIRYLIEEAMEIRAGPSQLEILKELKIELGEDEFPSITRVTNAINKEYGEQKYIEWARWYIYGVFAFLSNLKINNFKKFGFTKEKSYKLSIEFYKDEPALNSLIRELENSPEKQYTILDFSYDTLSGKSSPRTIAFMKAKELLESEFDFLKKRKKKNWIYLVLIFLIVIIIIILILICFPGKLV